MSRSGSAQAKVDRRTLLKASGASAAALAMPGLTTLSTSVAGAQDAALLQVGIGTDIDHLDPRQINTQEAYFACANVYDCLVLYELGTAKIRPAVWPKPGTISEDGLVYTFHLRQGVTFHDGTPFNADAVITWYNSIKEGAPGSQFDATKMPYMEGFLTDLVSAVEKVDDATVIFTLPTPYSPLLANLAIPIFGIPSPTAIEQYGLDVSVNPSGTGAFSLASPDDWIRDSQMTLTREPELLGRCTARAKVVSRSRRRARLDCSRSNRARSTSPSSSHRMTSTRRRRTATCRSSRRPVSTPTTSSSTSPKTLHQQRGPAGAELRRQQGRASEGLYAGGMVPAGGVLPPSDWAYNPDLKGYPYDPDKAKELLNDGRVQRRATR